MNKDIKLSETPADERLAEIIGRFPELNMSNYTDVEVDRLNAWGIELCEAWDDTRPVAPTVSSSAAPSADPHWKLYADHFQVEPHEIDYDGVEWLAFVAGVDAALATPSVQAVAAPVAGQAVPAGWKLVPIEPTENMVVDGFESAPAEGFSQIDAWEAYQAMSGCQQAAHRARLCYAAMLAAAPAASPVGLTDAEIQAIAEIDFYRAPDVETMDMRCRNFARAIERRLAGDTAAQDDVWHRVRAVRGTVRHLSGDTAAQGGK